MHKPNKQELAGLSFNPITHGVLSLIVMINSLSAEHPGEIINTSDIHIVETDTIFMMIEATLGGYRDGPSNDKSHVYREYHRNSRGSNTIHMCTHTYTHYTYALAGPDVPGIYVLCSPAEKIKIENSRPPNK